MICKKIVSKNFKNYLRKKYSQDFVFSSKNSLFDFVVFQVRQDLVFKLIFEGDFSSISEIKKFLLSCIDKKSFLRKKFYIVISTKRESFKFIEL